MKKPGKKTVVILCCLLVAAGAVGMKMMQEPPEAVPAVTEETAAINVLAQKPQVGSIAVENSYIGHVQPDESVSVFPKVSGTVSQAYFNIGDTVKKGDLLFEIDPEDIMLSVRAAQTQVDVAQANMDKALGSSFDLQLAQLESSVKQAQNAYSNARQSLKDYNDDEDDVVDQAKREMDNAYDDMKMEESNLGKLNDQLQQATDEAEKERLQAQIKDQEKSLGEAEQFYLMKRSNYNEKDDDDDPTRKNLRTASRNQQLAYDSANEIYALTKDEAFKETARLMNAQLEAAIAGYDSAAKKLEYTKIYAPIDGVIETKDVANNNNTPSNHAAYTISNKNIMTVRFNVPSNVAEELSIDDPVTIEYSNKTYQGTIMEVGTKTDEASGLFPIKARIEGENLPGLSGVSVKITVNTAKTEGAFLVPVDCVYNETDKSFVYTVVDGKAVKTYVETGLTDDEQIEIISGIPSDAQIITTWNPNLVDGVAISLKDEAETESAEAPAVSEPEVPESDAASEPDEVK